MKKKRKLMELMCVDVEKKIIFEYRGEQVQVEVLKNPLLRNALFAWLTVSRGKEHKQIHFPFVSFTNTGILAQHPCLGRTFHLFIPYEEIKDYQLITEPEDTYGT